MTDSLFRPDGDWLVPTDLTRSPWGPAHQHGGPPLALAVRGAETALPVGLEVWRVAAEILRPVPHAPLRVEAAVVRPGKRVALVESVVSDADGPLLLGRVWGIRRSEPLDYPEPPDPLPVGPAAPETLEETRFSLADYTWFGDSLETRLAAGTVGVPGRVTAWFKLRVPVVAGEEATPAQRLSAMVDSGNGVSAGLPLGSWLFINSDVTAYLLRAPQGEWFALEAVSHYDRSGRGIAESRLFDRNGYLGRSHQALFVERLET